MHLRLALVLAACVFVAAALPKFPRFHPPSWTTVLDTQWGATAIATNDYAAYVVVNNTVSSFDGFTGAARWVNNVSGVFAVVQITVNNKWVIVQTGIDFFVFDANLGTFASQSRNYTDVTGGTPNVVATQFDDVFMGVEEWSPYIAEMTPSGELQAVWTSNMTNVISFGVAPGTPYVYYIAESTSLQVVNIQSRDAVCTIPTQVTSQAATNGRLAILDAWGAVRVIDLFKNCSLVWENALDYTFSGFLGATVIQTEGTVIVTGSHNAMNPLFVLNAETGEQIANYTATGQGYQLLASTIAAGRLVALVLNLSNSDTTPVLVAMDPSTGAVLSSCIVPSLPAPNYVIASIGHGAVMVPNAQGFATFSAIDVSTPLSYNLDSPGATSAAVFTSPRSSVFMLVEGSSISGFESSL